MSFGEGLNIITGETGAGKSVLMGALDLVLGGRSDKSMIREGESEAWVEATFQLKLPQAINDILESCGLPVCEDSLLLIRRSISVAGSSRCLVNDAPATVQTLRRIGDLLVDIHGPYDHQSLLVPDFQRNVLDAYGHCSPTLKSYTESWTTLQTLEKRLAELKGDTTDFAGETDRLQFIIDEISRAELTSADEDDLVTQHAQAANAEQILAIGNAIAEGLTDGDTSAFNQLVTIQTQLMELTRILPDATAWRNDAQSIAVQLQELSQQIADCLSRIESDPEHLQQIEGRMLLVQRLKRKYGHSVLDVLSHLNTCHDKLSALEGRAEQIATLELDICTAQACVVERAQKLTQQRTQAAGKLGRAITKELHDLGFLKSGFSVDLLPCDPCACGADIVSYGFAPNPGEPMRPLKAIASSGEIARVMLAVKAVLATHDSIPVLVFDEIDANIGGEIGRVVGEKLRNVARTHQIISITHLPQSAVYGQQHYVVTKEVIKGRTCMRIQALQDEQRVDEIARMLGGKGLTSVIESHARELLASACCSGANAIN